LTIHGGQLISISKCHLQAPFPQMSSKQFIHWAFKIIFGGRWVNDIDFRLKDFQDFWLESLQHYFVDLFAWSKI